MKYSLKFKLFTPLVKGLHALLLLAFVFAMLSATHTYAQEKPLPAAAFVKKMDVPFVKVSPNGKLLATAILQGAGNELCVLNVSTLSLVPAKFSLPDVESAEWMDDDTLVVIGKDALDVNQVFRVDVNKGEATQLSAFPGDYENRTSTFQLFPPYMYKNGMEHLFISFYRGGGSLQQISLKNNSVRTTVIYDHPNDHFIPATDPDYLFTEEWSKGEYKVMRRSRLNSKAETLMKGTDTDAVQIHPIVGLPKSDKVYAEVTDGDTARVQIYDLKEKSLGAIVLNDKDYDVEARPIVLPYTGEVVGFEYQRDKPYSYYLNEAISKVMVAVDKALPGRHNSIESVSLDTEIFAIFSMSDVQPGEYYLYDASKKELRKFLGRAEWLPEDKLSPMKPIRYLARDGLSIDGYFTVPRSPVEGKPLIVLPHGGPHVRDAWGYDEWAQFFASRGYAVIQPNYRISDGYGELFFEKGWKEVGYAIQNDVLDGMKWAQDQGYGKAGNVCIVGASFGGYAAMRAATVNPELFRCVIAIAGFYDIPKLLEADKDKPFYSFMTKVYGEPKRDGARMSDASPINAIDNLKAPVLVVHGELDSKVKYEQATNLIEKLKSKGKTYETLLRPDEGHSFFKMSNRRKLLETMEQFLGHYLQDPAIANTVAEKK